MGTARDRGRHGRRAVAAGAALTAAFATLAACAGGSAEGAGPVAVESEVRPDSATLGDLLVWTVTVRHDPDVEIEIGEPEAEIEGLARVEARRRSRRPLFARRVEELIVTLRAQRPGAAELPALPVRWRPAGDAAGEGGELASQPLAVEVVSVLPEGGAEDIRDLKPLRRVPRAAPWVGLAAALIALAAAVAAFRWWRRRRGREPEPVPARPAHELAFAALAALREVDTDDWPAVRRHYYALSETVRAYVEGRFGLNATDLTTEEILARLARVEGLAGAEAERLGAFLRATDRVKFAHHRPGADDVESAWRTARDFVEATRPLEPPADGEERAAGEREAA